METEPQFLGPGITQQMVLDAITRSGYPLQAKAVEIALSVLKSSGVGDTRTFEEWSFVDSDSGTVRQLDALIQHTISDVNDLDQGDPSIPTDPRALLRYELDLLMECKQAELPFVFFTREALTPPTLPLLCGLPHQHIAFGEAGEEPFVEMTVEDALFDEDLPGPSPESAISVSRCFRKGQALELSGEDVFRSLTAPLRKALDHYQELSAEGADRHLYHDIRMVHPVVVLDAPMFACEARAGSVEIKPISIARLSLSEPSTSNWYFTGYNRRSSLDFVHVDALKAYCDRALERAARLATRLDAAALQVVTGRAVVEFDASTTASDKADAVAEPYSLSTFVPSMTAVEAADWIAAEFHRVHQPGTDETDARLAEG